MTKVVFDLFELNSLLERFVRVSTTLLVFRKSIKEDEGYVAADLNVVKDSCQRLIDEINHLLDTAEVVDTDED